LIPPSNQNGEGSQAVEPFKNRLPVILLLACIFFFNFLARFVWGPLLPNIEADTGIRHTEAGSLFFMINIGYFSGLLLSGHISSRLNHHKTVVVSCITCALAIVAAMTVSSVAALRVILVVIGTTGGLYLPSGLVSMTYRLEPRDFGKAFAFHEISPSLGFIVAPLLAELLLGHGSWRAVLWPAAAGLLAAGLLYARKPRTDDFRGQPPTVRNMRSVAGQSAYWLMLVLFVFGIGTNVGVYSMLPLYLQAEIGMQQTVVNVILSASRIAAMVSPFAAGWLAYRYGPRPVVAVIVVLTGITTALLGLAGTQWLWIPLFVQPLLATAFFPAGYAIVMRIVAPDYRNLIVAMIMPAAMLVGSGALPTVIGGLADADHFRAGFVLIGVLSLSTAACLLFVKPKGK
jgi:NNP family nitrate/nitrite transporter-like MFS transporter